MAKIAITPVERTESSLAEQVVNRLRQLLIESEARSGDRIGAKDEMRRKLRVSHGVMNQALSILETQGIIELRRGANGGIFVAPSADKMIRLSQFNLTLRRSNVEFSELLEIRAALEPPIIVAAARMPDTKEKRAAVGACRKLIEQMSAADPGELNAVHLNWQFHRTIAGMSKTAVLGLLYRTIIDAIEEFVVEANSADTPEHYDEVVAMHSDILEAIASGDVGAAARAAARHPLPQSPGSDEILLNVCAQADSDSNRSEW